MKNTLGWGMRSDRREKKIWQYPSKIDCLITVDAENIQLKEFDEYFSKASDDDLMIDLIEEFYIEKGLLPKE